MSFNVGDRVRVTAGGHTYNMWQERYDEMKTAETLPYRHGECPDDGMEGIVLAKAPHPSWAATVYLINFEEDGHAYLMNDSGIELVTHAPAPAPTGTTYVRPSTVRELSVGDRVRSRAPYGSVVITGMMGTIKDLIYNPTTPVGVEWDEYRTEMHSLNGHSPANRGYYVPLHCIEKLVKVEEEEDIVDLVEMADDEDATVYECSICHCVVNSASALTLTDDDEHVCNDCLMENYSKCYECGGYFRHEDITIANEGLRHEHYVCSDCLTESNGYYQCSVCNEYFTSYHLAYSEGEAYICDDCYPDNRACYTCGTVHSVDEMTYDDDNEEYYCDSCYRVRPRNVINDYNYSPDEFEFLGDDDFNHNLFMGVELEVDGAGNETAAKVKAALVQDITDEVYIKHDGSLNEGFEIVTMPATLDYHVNNMQWDTLASQCVAEGMRSHDTDTCGLHVHVSRDAFGDDETQQDLNIAKLILLVNKFWDSHIIKFTRRKRHALERWANRCDMEYNPHDDNDDIVDKVDHVKGQGRYQAINITNDDTVEFRMFKGTLNTDTILATLEWVHAMTLYACDVRLAGIATTKWEDMLKDSSMYPYMWEYMAKRHLTTATICESEPEYTCVTGEEE
jgi:hypothetical protein